MLIIILISLLITLIDQSKAATWCIARSGASDTSLQLALDYACGPGSADCQPIQSSGLCYLPNTLQAHASYAFNSFYQRSNGAPGACDFGGVALVTVTDPSYGSCTYPSSTSSAGGSIGSPPGTQTPTTPITGTPSGSTPTFMPLTPFGGTGTGTGFNYNSAVPVNNVSFRCFVLLGTCFWFVLMLF